MTLFIPKMKKVAEYSGVFGEFANDYKKQIKNIFRLNTEEAYNEYLSEICGEFSDEEVIDKVLEAEPIAYYVEYDEAIDGFHIYVNEYPDEDEDEEEIANDVQVL